MKYLIFGDVHGNLPALELVLKQEKYNYDCIICHGDVVNYGPWSNECVLLLNSLSNAIMIKGNHEQYFIDGAYNGTHPIARDFFNFCYPKFKVTNLIEKYVSHADVSTYRIQHTILNKYIYSNTELEANSLDRDYIIGHSHQQFERIIGKFRLINTGSLGQNRSYINLAEYILYDDISNKIEKKNIVFDIKSIIDHMTTKGYSKQCLEYYKNKRII